MELLELSIPKRREYLKHYYEVSSRFYEVADTIVSQQEIDECVARYKEKPAPQFRKHVRLTDWKFSPHSHEEDKKVGPYSARYDESQWETVSVPHAINHIPDDPVPFGESENPALISEAGQSFTLWRGDCSVWYKKRLRLDALTDNQIATLSFESINLKSDVWVNGNLVMLDHLGLFPYQMDVTKALQRVLGGETVLAVRVSNTAATEPELFYNGMQYAYSARPFSDGRTEFDWKDQAWAGMAGNAVLTITDKCHIENAFLFTKDIRNGQAVIECVLTLRNAACAAFTGQATVEVSKWLPEESETVVLESCEVSILPSNDTEIRLDICIENAKLWDTEHPNLYLAHIVLIDAAGNPVDDLYETFGARTIQMKGSNFYLNGRKVILRGTHDACHYADEPAICPSDNAIVKDLLLHKKMGANCSRWPSDIRMHYKKISDYCDQIGFMLSWAGYFEMWNIHPEAELYATRDVKAMMRSLRNCPSLIIWEMGDETLEHASDYRRFRWFESMYELVYAEDRSRPIIPSGYYSSYLVNMTNSRPESEPEDRLNAVLADYPFYSKELAVWDYHYCPCLLPIRPYKPVIDSVKNALQGRKATIFTEFGCDGLPNPENIRDLYGGFHWAESPFIASSREKIDYGCYGENVTPALWRETQAFQAAIIGGMIGYLRQTPESFAGFYFPTMFDVWTFFWGAVDALGNAKLLYYVARNYYQPIYVSSLRENVVLHPGDTISISVSNYGEPLADVTLKTNIKDISGNLLSNWEAEGLAIAGDCKTSLIVSHETPRLAEGFHSIEYRLFDSSGELISKNIELFLHEH